MPFFESADELPIPYAGTLSSFGSPADGKVVKRTTFTLQGNTGSGMATISSDKYYVRRSTGRVELRDMDDSDNILDWQAYMDYQDLGNIAFRATYTVKVQAGTTTTYTNETVTMAEIDPYASGSGDGGIDAEIPQNLWVQEIHAEFGDIGGWNIDSTTISSDSGNVVIDSSTPKITMGAASAVLTGKGVFIGKSSSVYKFRVGNPADGYILWDDTTLSVEGNVSINGTLTVSGSAKSDDFSAGVSGWRIRGTTSDAEFQNIKARGRFEAAVFVKAMESAHAGTHVVAKSAGKLDADMTVPGSGTWVMTLDDPPDTGYLLDNNDICVVTETQGSTSKTWFTVQRLAQSGGQQTYTCTYSSGTRPNTFHKGNIVVDYGVSGQGFLLMTADATGAPFYSVRTHAGSPWSATTERGRLGNMYGAFGTGSNNYYGFGVGDYSGGNYLKYETNGGFKLSAGNGGITMNATGLNFSANATSYITWDTVADIYGNTSGSAYGELYLRANPSAGYSLGRLFAQAQSSGGDTALLLITANNSNQYAAFVVPHGLIVGQQAGAALGSYTMHLYGTAPTLYMNDATASAKSMLVTVDANLATFKEVAGNALLTFDLANYKALVGNGTSLGVNADLFNANTDYSSTSDFLVGAFHLNFTGTTNGNSLQGVEGYVTTSNASGTVTRSLGVIAHTHHKGAGAVTDAKVFVGSHIQDNGSGAVTNAFIFKSDGIARVGTPGTITNGYGLYLDALPSSGVTNRYGIYQAGASDANYFAGGVTANGALTVNGAFTSIGIDDNSDAVALTIDSTERVILTGTSTMNHAGMNTILQGYSITTSATAVAGASFGQFSADTRGSQINLSKSRNTSIGVGTVVSSGDTLGQILFVGDDGDSFDTGATIRAIVDGTPGNGDMPTRLEFLTSADGSNTPTLRLTLKQNGSAILGSAAIATNATDGFLYVVACAGTPTGTPTAVTGRIPFVVDSTNNKAYIYSGGAWVALN